jgi:hypothetical protein
MTGIIDTENILEFVMIKNALEKNERTA